MQTATSVPHGQPAGHIRPRLKVYHPPAVTETEALEGSIEAMREEAEEAEREIDELRARIARFDTIITAAHTYRTAVDNIVLKKRALYAAIDAYEPAPAVPGEDRG